MKTLFISDLDGTLLNNNAELSEYTKSVINNLMDSGGYFSIATARTRETVKIIFAGAEVNVPAVLMNGACLYDMRSNKYVYSHSIIGDSLEKLINAAVKYDLSGFIYSLKNEMLSACYTKLSTPQSRTFYDERVRKYAKPFEKLGSFAEAQDSNRNIIYFSVCDKREKLDPVVNELRAAGNMNIIYYKDIYDLGLWYMEVCSAKASKYSAVEYLRHEYKFDKVVTFGDNHNDISLFKAGDECYAVANAVTELKAHSTDVISGNTDDGVAKWLVKNAFLKDEY
ncbi:MAG: HAD-IIB family hydrolase [Oscillospiraceae bacterium]|nr:HAD-IIB family hydrolase [Oscillospiraceae bacterium]